MIGLLVGTTGAVVGTNIGEVTDSVGTAWVAFTVGTGVGSEVARSIPDPPRDPVAALAIPPFSNKSIITIPATNTSPKGLLPGGGVFLA
jgi:hypothetical protein